MGHGDSLSQLYPLLLDVAFIHQIFVWHIANVRVSSREWFSEAFGSSSETFGKVAAVDSPFERALHSMDLLK